MSMGFMQSVADLAKVFLYIGVALSCLRAEDPAAIHIQADARESYAWGTRAFDEMTLKWASPAVRWDSRRKPLISSSSDSSSAPVPVASA